MRFAVLFHQVPAASSEHDHFDLLLEHDGALLTWRLASEPFLDDQRCPAVELPPHRLAYLTHEGPVSGNRGTVKRVAGGEFEWIDSPGANAKPLRATLKAAEIWELTLTPPSGAAADWVVEWHRLR
jgi:hypothetical protein